MPTRLARAHGKNVFRVGSLVIGQMWAKAHVHTRGATEIDDVEDVM